MLNVKAYFQFAEASHLYKPLWLIGIHTKPSKAFMEIANLKEVYGWYNLSGDDVIILGDLNYGYVNKRDTAILKNLFTDFEDVIGETDTSTRRKDSAHDRYKLLVLQTVCLLFYQ